MDKAAAPVVPKTYPTLSREEVGRLIAAGRKIVIFNQYVLKVDAWLPYHPGGDKAMLHMVGRDATDEIKAYDALPDHTTHT
ncbi:MAG: cytochrome b5-like heme/steroid binding domain-containing protein [Candidatus Binatia bacterium]